MAKTTRPPRMPGHYSHEHYPGVAFTVVGAEFHSRTSVSRRNCLHETKFPTGNVLAVMVGDDRKIPTNPKLLTKITPRQFCPVCGQIGCQSHSF